MSVGVVVQRVLIAVFACFAFACVDRASKTELVPGVLAPELALVSLNNSAGALTDYRGKVVLVNFWASWCVPCVSEMPSLQRLHRQLHDKGLVVLGVGVDDALSELRAFQEKLGITFPILVDREGLAKERYGVSGVPETILISRQGKILNLLDADTGSEAVRVLGPREWDQPRVVSYLEQVLGQP